MKKSIARGKNLENHIAEQNTERKKEIGRRSGRLDFTNYEPAITLEDEWFGGFEPDEPPSEKVQEQREQAETGGVERINRQRKYPEIPFYFGVVGERDKAQAYWPGWTFRRGKRKGERIIPVGLDGAYHLARRFAFFQHLECRVGERVAADQPNQPPPFDQYLLRAIEQNERGRPAPDDPELDRYYSGEARPGSNDPTGLWSGRNVLHEERVQFYSQHAERRTQALYCRSYKPSRRFESKRFPTLKRIKRNPLLTETYLGRGGLREYLLPTEPVPVSQVQFDRYVYDDRGRRHYEKGPGHPYRCSKCAIVDPDTDEISYEVVDPAKAVCPKCGAPTLARKPHGNTFREHAEVARLKEQFFAKGGQIRKCPEYKLASQCVVGADSSIVEKPPKKMGRPRINPDKPPLTDRERKQRQNAKAAKAKRTKSNARRRPTAGVTARRRRLRPRVDGVATLITETRK